MPILIQVKQYADCSSKIGCDCGCQSLSSFLVHVSNSLSHFDYQILGGIQPPHQSLCEVTESLTRSDTQNEFIMISFYF